MPGGIDLKTIKPEQLLDSEVKGKVIQEVADLKFGLWPDLAWDFWQELKAKIKELGPEAEKVEKEYAGELKTLEIISFGLLPEVEAKRVIQENFVQPLTWPGFNWLTQLDDYLMAKVPLTFRDKFKRELSGALKENQNLLTNEDLMSSDGKPLDPTVGNWLTEYDRNVGTGKVDPLKKTKFIYQGEQAKKLSGSERDKLVRLIDFYEHLKQTSEHPEGIEEKFVFKDVDRIVEIDHGKVVELAPTEEILKKEEQIDKIVIRQPKIDTFLEEPDQEKAPEKKNKFVKPKPMQVVIDQPTPPAQPRNFKPKLEEVKKKAQFQQQPPKEVKLPDPILSSHKPQPVKLSAVQAPVKNLKKPERVLSPIDELRQMSLEEFRALGENSDQVILKILEKIDLLEQESVAKRVEGIRAWKESVVAKLYVEIGEESIRQNKSVKEVIISREQSGKPYLTYQEFEALADLNRQLRF